MNKLLMLILLLLWVSGCTAAQFSKELETHADLSHKSVTSVGMVPAWDERPSERAGTIGTVTITVKKSDLIEFVSSYLLNYIHEKIGLNVERVQMNDADSVKLSATKNRVNGIILLRIKELKMDSLAGPLQSAKVGLTLELTVFDDSGTEIYRRTVKEHYEKHVDLTVTELRANELVEAAVKGALKEYVKDPELKKIIAKFKYGTVGGVIAGIF